MPALTIIQGGGTVHRDESNRNLQFDRNSLSNYKVVDTGDFIVHLRSFEGGLEKATCCGLVSPAYHIFRGKNVDSDFYYLYFRSKRFIDADLKPHVYGIRDGRSIDIEGMKTIFIPWTNLAEQRRIGAFFDHLDSLITLHQRKYDKLCVLKKSMLDKMFPKGGSLYPEIRFAGFTDPWEQRKLGELYQKNDERNTDGLGSERTLSVASMTFNSAGNGADDSSLPNYKRLRLGDIAFEGHTNKEFAYGRFVLNDAGNGIMSPRFTCLRPIVEQEYSFWKYFIHSEKVMRPILVNSTKSGTMMNELVVEDFLKQEILVPSLPEQRRIGAFFDRLDSLITLHQRKYCGVVSWMLGVALVRLSSEK